MIYLFSVNNTSLTETRHSSIWIIRQFLEDNSVKSKCYDYWFKLYDSLDPTYVREIPDMPNFVKTIENYKTGRGLTKGLDLNDVDSNIILEILNDIDKIDLRDNDIIGFSITNVSYFYLAISALYIKTINSNVKTVFGGYHVSLSKNLLQIFLDNGIADVMVIDDGCQPMLDISKGLVTSGIITGEFKETISWPKLSRIDSYLSKGHIATVTSFGCPFNCTFCASKRPYVNCDVDEFSQYLELMCNVGFKYLEVNDDNFNSNLDRAMDFTDVIRKSNISTWSVWAHPSRITKEWTRELKRSQCDKVYLGVESFSPKVLELANKAKDQSPDDGIKAIENLVEQGIVAMVGLIVGMPGETDEEFNKTLTMAKQINHKYNKLVSINPVMFKIYPNSDHYINPDKYGIKFSNWDEIDIPKSFEMEGISHDSVTNRMTQLQTECKSRVGELLYSIGDEMKIIK